MREDAYDHIGAPVDSTGVIGVSSNGSSGGGIGCIDGATSKRTSFGISMSCRGSVAASANTTEDTASVVSASINGVLIFTGSFSDRQAAKARAP